MVDILSWIIGTRRAVGHSLQNDVNDIRLPIELWVAICGLLSPKDQRSLAESCKRLFSVVHLNTPSTVVKIDNCRVKPTGWKHKDRSYLRSATEIHWSGLKHNWVETRRRHAVFSVLPTIPNIRLLSLYDADINRAQQAIILGLSTLRTLVVHSCRFHPSTKPLPLSHVTTLRLTNTDTQTTRHLLTILATTVETLETGYPDNTVGSILQHGFIELPKLSTISLRGIPYGVRLAISSTFKRYTSITTLCILFHVHSFETSLDDSYLPALRSLTCDHRLAVSLIPNRPVTTYVEVGSYRVAGLLDLIDALSKTSARITRLSLFISDNLHSLLPSLATALQFLEQLILMPYAPMSPKSWLGPRSPDLFSTPPPHNPHGAVAMILPMLQRVVIWVDNFQFTVYSPGFDEFLREYFIPVCPALEVFECLSFGPDSPDFESGQPPEPKQAWKTRRLPGGSWERQGPPPTPTPIPAQKLRAAP